MSEKSFSAVFRGTRLDLVFPPEAQKVPRSVSERSVRQVATTTRILSLNPKPTNPLEHILHAPNPMHPVPWKCPACSCAEVPSETHIIKTHIHITIQIYTNIYIDMYIYVHIYINIIYIYVFV